MPATVQKNPAAGAADSFGRADVFGTAAIIDVNTKVDTRSYGCSSSVCQYFNPFDASYTAVEGLDYEYGEVFGEPENDGDFQLPRTVRFSVGVRF